MDKPTPQDWEREFDQRFVDTKEEDACGAGCCMGILRTFNDLGADPDVIKDYMNRLLSSRDKQLVGELLGAVEDSGIRCTCSEGNHEFCGPSFNTAREAIITKAREMGIL